jgi:hypothetical protein
VGDSLYDQGMSATRWRVRYEGEDRDGILETPHGRRFEPGDLLSLPPPPEGTIWTVLSIEDAPGYDGRLIVGNPRPQPSGPCASR